MEMVREGGVVGDQGSGCTAAIRLIVHTVF
jgi:hypothetical protein